MAGERLDGIAVLGMAGRFPGAASLEEFWRNLRDGVESIRRFDDAELAAAGVPEAVRRDPRYVPAGAPLEGVDQFDAPFFRFSPREAALLDPQHRLFLECCWEALEDAGYDPRGMDRPVGVYAGAYASNYLLFNLSSHPELLHSVGFLNARILNDKDFLAVRASYLLDLKGPAMTVQTACSTSLVALHQACRSLFTYECDVALAGGVGLTSLDSAGYLYQDGGIFSPDGHCRPFAADARGTVPGNGGGVVVLKRLEDAVADGDRVRAVVRGTAVNNDGALKVGFTAPSVDAQAEVVAAALEFAEVPAETVTYVETHGTGTSLGDRIELEALRRAFGAAGGSAVGPAVGPALGSVKSNIGHLDAAAGIASVIKTVLALEHRILPPSLHCTEPASDLAVGEPAFRVVGEAEPWRSPGSPRRAGVSSFGVGGTNAHAVLEEAPVASPTGRSRGAELLVVSTATASALPAAVDRLAGHLEGLPSADSAALADAAYTLARGRHAFPHRVAVVAADAATAARRLHTGSGERRQGVAAEAPPPVAFLFPGQGSQHPGMGRRSYADEPRYRRHLDAALEALKPHVDGDLRRLILSADGDEGAAEALRRTELAQPALFAVEHALGRLWLDWGIEPAVMVGHSVGDFAAACLAGVFDLEDAAALVAARGQLVAEMPPGAMLGVGLPTARLEALVGDGVSLAALNAPNLGVLSGPRERIEELAARFTAAGVENRRLHTSHAFHSAMMQPASEAFAAEVARRRLRPPQRPLLSATTGAELSAEEAVDPGYWAAHLRRPVRFVDAAATLLELPGAVFLEIGPGRTLSSLVQRTAQESAPPATGRPIGDEPGGNAESPAPVAVTSWPHPKRPSDDREHLLAALGHLWTAGVEVDWQAFHADATRRRVGLPTYPFERRRYWVEVARRDDVAGDGATAGGRGEDVFDVPSPVGEASSEEELAGAAAVVAVVWQELLGVTRAGAHDDFFELGGHSLLATQAVSRLRDGLGVELTLDDLFAHPTPATLGHLLAERSGGQGDAPPILEPRRDDGPAQLSFAQQRLWFLDRLLPGDTSYNLGGAVRVRGRLDAGRLTAALVAVAARHEVLRTRFPESPEGEPRQVADGGPPALPRIDLSALHTGVAHRTAEAAATALASRPFALAAAPPVRFLLLHVAPAEHLLAFCVHHVVSDAWSHHRMLAEIAALYRATEEGSAEPAVSPLPALPVQYADFAVWQRRWLEGGELERQLAYWRSRLAGAPAVLDLPLDRPRPAVRDGRGATLAVELPPALTSGVERLAAEAGATPFMAILALFRALLGRYSGQRDVVVGTVVANRTRSELESLIGFFANTLALRGDLAPADGESEPPGAATLVERTRLEALAAYRHQDLPFERLVDDLQVRRDLSHGPLFQVLVTLQNLPRREVDAGDLRFEPLVIDPGSSRFDLSLDLAPDGDRLAGALGYATALFDRATVERLWGHFQVMVEAALAQPAKRYDDLPLLDRQEHRQLTSGWNETATPVDPRPVHRVILAAAAGRPADQPAVIAADRTWSYGDLVPRVRSLAAALHRAGMRRGDRVGLLLDRDADLPLALLAVLASGGAYVPLDPAYPEDRLRLMIEDSGLGVLVTAGAAKSALPPSIAGVAVLDLDAAEPAAEPDNGGAEPEGGAWGDVTLTGEDLAYVIYTSGSTGRPKGVQISHAALANFLASMARRPGMAAGEVLLAVTTPSFDIAGLELLLPLLVGGTVVVAPRPVVEDGVRLAASLAEHRVDLMQATPATWRLLVDAGFTPPPGLRVLCGGEALPPPLAAALGAVGSPVWNLYGPTETTVWSTVQKVSRARPAGNVGTPVANTSIQVVDRRARPVPVGVPGELWIGGAGLARGYLGRPAMTAERFVPDPWSPLPGGRLYRTGDLARRRGDSSLEILGRLDHQVKVRGFRIELGEVEAALGELPPVAACVVVALGDVAEKRLVAYVEAAEGTAPEPAALRRELAGSLPSHLVPSVVVVLDALPLTPNGKVDRAALPAPQAAAAGEPVAPTAPRDATEELVAETWCQVLGVEEVGGESDFFELGGHSLLANRVVARLRDATGVELPLRAFFETPTVAGLAAAVERLRGDSAGPPLERRPRGGPAPLSYSQERLWFLQRLDPQSTAYNLPLALRLRGDLAAASLAAAVDAVVRRHEVLRTTFHDAGGRPQQRVSPLPPDRPVVVLPRVDLSALPAARREAAARRVGVAEVSRPFDLEAGPVLRPLLVRLDEDDHALLLDMHHVVSDEWSLEVLSAELATLYARVTAGRPAALPELPVQYADYAHWQREVLDDAALETDLAYWRRHLDGLPPLLDLPTDRPRGAVRGERGGRRPVAVPEGLAASLAHLARHSGSTLFMVYLAGFQVLLGRLTRQRDFAVGTPVAGRSRLQTEGLVGFLVNTLVLRANLAGDPAFDTVLGRVRETSLEAHAHGELPFERLVQELDPERSLSRTPLFQAAFVLQRPLRQGFELPGLRAEAWDVGVQAAQFDLALNVLEDGDNPRADLLYAADLFDAATIDRLGRAWGVLMAALAANPEAPVATLPLLTTAERDEVVATGRRRHRRRLPVARLEVRFSEWAHRTPQAVALRDRGETWSYARLDAAAGRLAAELEHRGVGRETRVGLFLGRGVRQVIAILGVLKAGATYLPLDPVHPADRLRFVLSDAATPLLVSERGLAGELPVEDLPTLWLDELLAGGDGAPASPSAAPAVAGGVDDAAYVIYTSGSTGRPKGVVVSHRQVDRLLTTANEIYSFAAADVWSLFHSYAFDVSVFEIWGALAHGASVVVVPRMVAVSPPETWELLRSERVTILSQTPTAFRGLVAAAVRAEGGEGGVEGAPLRLVIFAGEALEMESLRPWFALFGDRQPRLVNMYGITETTVHTTYRWLTADDLEVPARGSAVGGALHDLDLHLLDSRMQPVPVGITGEIHVGGDGLARGYLDRPALTAQRFLPHPFPLLPGERVYRSGDLARRTDDGDLEYLGRADQQVQLRGFRIELGEVETALQRLPEVDAAAVLVHAGPNGEDRLVAWVVPAPGAAEIDLPEESSLRRELGRDLPDYMIPSAFVRLDALPLTANGKLDRRALPAPEWPTDSTAAGRPPRGPVEQLLVQVAAGLIGREDVTMDDDFFALGGHSLLAVGLVARVRDAVGIDLPVRTVFDHPRLADLARQLEARMRAGAGLALPPLRAEHPRPHPVPLTFAQERLWFLQRLDPASTAYNLPLALRLRGRLSVATLAAAIDAVVRRHEVLRTTFHDVDGRLRQRVSPPPSGRPVCALPRVDLSALPVERREPAALRVGAAEVSRPFDLASGPVLRALLVRLAVDDHALLLDMHHVVSDERSLEVLSAELATLYGAGVAGRSAALPELPVQYADYALWQREALDEATLEADLDYWRRHLDGLPPLLDLPTDRPRGAVRSERGGSRTVVVPEGLAALLAHLARRTGCTLFMVYLAGFQVLLSRLTGQRDFAVGTPVAGRSRLETEGLVGFLVNTLVLRADLAGDPGFDSVLGRVRETSLEAHAHGEVPFERLVQELNPDRSLSRTPLFQVAFALQRPLRQGFELPGLRAEPWDVGVQAAQFDLALNVLEDGDRPRADLLYAVDLFDAATVDRLGRAWGVLMAAVAADPEAPVAALPLLTAAEHRQLTAVWNDTATPVDPRPVHQTVLAAATTRPVDRPAVVAADRTWTYGELVPRVRALTARLRRAGIGRGHRVGLLLERTADLPLALLAALASGGAYVPLDPAYPEERLRLMIEDSGLTVLVTGGKTRSALPPSIGGITVLDLDETEPTVPEAGWDGGAADGTAVEGEDLAYVIYTSGSTGRPKGVQISHAALANFLATMANRPGMEEGESLLAVTTPSFDIAALELLLPLLVGGTVVVAPRPVVEDGARLATALAEHRSDLMQATPATWRLLVDAGFTPPPGLRVLCGGEALPSALAAALGADGAPVWNLYGPTETTVWSTVQQVSPDRPAGNVGTPVANTSVHLVSDRARPVPVGVPGELWIGGAGLARGYLGRPSLTAERFVPDPWSPVAGGRLYRTGDLARRRDDGTLDVLGRLDHQVKVRGFRIELGEVEAALAELPPVGACVVVAQGDVAEKRLVAYVEAAEGTVPEPAALRRELATTLPSHLVPSVVVVLDALPLTPNGKVDRKALPAPQATATDGPAQPTPPRDATEKLVAEAWCQVLGVEELGVESDFFDLGGHSLLANRVVVRLRDATGVELPLRAFFDHPRLEDQARQLAERMRAGAGRALPPLLAEEPRPEPVPLTFAQEQLWFLQRMDPDSPNLNMPLRLDLRGDLSTGRLVAAVAELVRRHESLRTWFPEDGGRPRQEVAPPSVARLPLIDLSGLGTERARAEADLCRRRDARRPFDLTAAPPLRTSLLRLAPDHHVGMFTAHHVLADDWSLGVLVRDLAAIYEASGDGRPSPLPELPVQMPDYALWQRRVLDGERLEERLAYWRRQLAGIPEELALPRDEVVAGAAAGARLTFDYPEELTRGVGDLARRAQVSRFVVLWAALAALFAQESGQRDLVIGADVAGRDQAATEELIGYFVNVLVLRADLSGNPTFFELLARVRRVVLDAFSHGDLPFDRLVQDLRPRRLADRTPLVQAMLSYHDSPRPEVLIGDLEVNAELPEEITARRDLTLFFRDVGGAYAGAWIYDPGRFREATVERLARRYRSLLEAVVEEPGRTLDDLCRGRRGAASGEARRQRRESRLQSLLESE